MKKKVLASVWVYLDFIFIVNLVKPLIVGEEESKCYPIWLWLVGIGTLLNILFFVVMDARKMLESSKRRLAVGNKAKRQ